MEPQSVLTYRCQGDKKHTKKVEQQKPVRQEGNNVRSEGLTRKYIRRGDENYVAYCYEVQGNENRGVPVRMTFGNL